VTLVLQLLAYATYSFHSSSSSSTVVVVYYASLTDFSDSQWLQASLPVRYGGLGVRRVSSLALPAYLASAASTLSLQNEILSRCAVSENTFFQTYLSLW